jgi:hypothetical protein
MITETDILNVIPTLSFAQMRDLAKAPRAKEDAALRVMNAASEKEMERFEAAYGAASEALLERAREFPKQTMTGIRVDLNTYDFEMDAEEVSLHVMDALLAVMLSPTDSERTELLAAWYSVVPV